MYADVHRYRDALRRAFASRQLSDWNEAHRIAHQLIDKYGTTIYARMDNIAYRYC